MAFAHIDSFLRDPGRVWEVLIKGMKDVLDRARIIEIRLEQQGRSMGEEIRAILSPHEHASLSHMLLATLPVSEAVTTNYDELLERSAGLLKKALDEASL